MFIRGAYLTLRVCLSSKAHCYRRFPNPIGVASRIRAFSAGARQICDVPSGVDG